MTPPPGQRNGRREAPGTRSEFRAFVRAHHPDRGGDPQVFAAGVVAYRAAQCPAARGPGEIVFVRRRRGAAGLLSRWLTGRTRRRRPGRVR